MTRFGRNLKSVTAVVALQLTLFAFTSCAPMSEALNSPTFNDISSILEQSLLAEEEGQIENAVGFARRATRQNRAFSRFLWFGRRLYSAWDFHFANQGNSTKPKKSPVKWTRSLPTFEACPCMRPLPMRVATSPKPRAFN